MFSSWFSSIEQTRFESTPEFKTLNPEIKKIRAQHVALKKAAESAVVGSAADLKSKVFEKLISELDAHIAAFNQMPVSDNQAEQARQKRIVTLQLNFTIERIQDQYWAEIGAERSGVKRVAGTAAMFGAAVAPIAAFVAFPPAGLTLLGEVAVGAAAGIGGLGMAGAVEEVVRPTRTYSSELLYSALEVIKHTYTSLAFKLSQEELYNEISDVKKQMNEGEMESLPSLCRNPCRH